MGWSSERTGQRQSPVIFQNMLRVWFLLSWHYEELTASTKWHMYCLCSHSARTWQTAKGKSTGGNSTSCEDKVLKSITFFFFFYPILYSLVYWDTHCSSGSQPFFFVLWPFKTYTVTSPYQKLHIFTICEHF